MDETKLCPFKFNEKTISEPWLLKCDEKGCSWWNTYYERCCITVPAYLQGIQDRRQELKDLYK